ncbi:MAG: MFS transporter, partial [Acidobacteriota bacterium]|nr:MFS transporter [Acidobacteriota bacterium]
IGLATLGTIATAHAKALSRSGDSLLRALTGGYHLAYLVAAICVTGGILAAALILRPPTASTAEPAGEADAAGDLLPAPATA